MFGQPALHDIYRRWRRILAEYGPDRILCAEANVDPLPRLADWVRPDEMHQAFNFPYLHAGLDVHRMRHIVTESLTALDAVAAPSTWVLSNHDVVRHATRFGYDGHAPRDGDGIGTWDPQPDEELGRSRAAAASLFMLGLPGGAYLYQGEELGLPDGIDIPDTRRQDPTFARTGGERLGRDGCRVPLPWRAGERNAGFGHGQDPWLPQPESFSRLARDVQSASPSSHLSLYKRMLELRRRLGPWPGLAVLVRGPLHRYEPCVPQRHHAGAAERRVRALELPAGRVLLRSSTPTGCRLRRRGHGRRRAIR